MRKLPHYTMHVSEDEEDAENIIRTSFVHSPASGQAFMVFNEDEPTKMEFKSMPAREGYERIVSGVLFPADSPIYRNHEGMEFYVSMSAEELKKAAINYMKNGRGSKFDTEHDQNEMDGFETIELWIYEDEGTVSPLLQYSMKDIGYTDAESLPRKGTIMMSVYVKDEKFFEEKILTGEVKGFSIDGYFGIDTFKEQFNKDVMKVKEMFAELGLNQHTGELITSEGPLAFSTNGVTLNDKEIVDGTYSTSSKFSVIIKEGKVVDFGFEEAAAPVVEPTPEPVAEPVAEVVAEQPVEAKVEEPKMDVTSIIAQAREELKKEFDAELARRMEAMAPKTDVDAKDKEIEELKSKLENEKKVKEEAIKNAAVPTSKSNSNNKPADFSPETHIVRKVGGKTYYIAK